MRLIDAESTKKLAQEHLIDPYHIISACAVIDKAETVDAVPVVRCRECARAEESVHPNTAVCIEHGKTMLCDDFCSYGERR